MMRLYRILFGTALMLLLIPISGLSGQEYRAKLKKAPLEVCKELTASAEKGEFKDLEKKLEPIKAVLDSLNMKYNVDLKKEFESAIKAKDKKAVQKSVWKLAYFDMRELLGAIVEKDKRRSGTLLKGWHKIAYLDYLYLSQEVADREYKPDKKEKEKGRKEEKGTLIDSRIKRLFRSAYFALGKTSPYKRTSTKADLDKYKEISAAIFTEIEKVFPDCKVVKKEEKKKPEKSAK